MGKELHGERLSWADLIVLAGSTALELAGANPMQFCSGRSDAAEGDAGSEYLSPNLPVLPNASINVPLLDNAVFRLKEGLKIMDMSPREIAVLTGGGHAIGRMSVAKSGYEGAWTQDPSATFSNRFFTTLLLNRWEPYNVSTSGQQAQRAASGPFPGTRMLNSDLIFKIDAEFLAISQEYAADNELFLRDFAAAWTRLMNRDRFDGPSAIVCDERKAA